MAKKIEEQYKSLSEIEHVRTRSGMYIGSTTSSTVESFIIDEQSGQFVKKEIEYTAGMLKLVDEILSNSVDEHKRCLRRRESTPTRQQKNVNILNKIYVDVNEDGRVVVKDNGGIPIAYHKDGKCYVPHFIFGNLRAGSNFDDTEKRNVVGTNGVGSSLANILSESFEVTTSDGEAKYYQKWTNGMRNVGEPTITLVPRKKYDMKKYPKNGIVTNKGMKTEKSLKVNIVKDDIGERGTTISFKMDMSIFPNEDTISYGVMKLIERKCILAAASNNELTVVFNGSEYSFKSFEDYVRLYGHDEIISGKKGRWEYCVGVTDLSMGNYNHSLVNSAECSQGEHISMANAIIRHHLKAFMQKKHKMTFTNDNISSQYVLYLNCDVVNPIYDSQTKEKLTTSKNNFDGEKGGEQTFLPKSLKEIEDSSIVKNLIALHEINKNSEEAKALRKKDSENRKKSVKAVDKLVDANARSRKDCVLWLFEGLSAANSFRSVRDPKIHGAYTLRGKVKNVYGKGVSEIMNNAELNDIVLAMGLRYDGKHDIKKLRYSQIVIATDADVDGINITGQLLAFFYEFFPELIENGMICVVNSPLYKLYGKNKTTKYIYSQDEFNKTRKSGYDIEYFKGLGSLGEDEYREMVTNPRLIQFFEDDDTSDTIKIWMSKDTRDERKRKMKNYRNNFGG